MSRRDFILLLCFIILPLLDKNPYHLDVLTTCGLFAILAVGLNVVVGYAGLLNLGYAAFYAIGAYTYAMVNVKCGVPFWPGLFLAGAASCLFGFLVGLPVIRVRGDYLAIVTLGFGEIVRIVLTNLDVTGGPNGLLGIDHPRIWIVQAGGGLSLGSYDFGVRSMPYYYLVLFLLIVIIFITSRLECSRLGRALAAVREDEVAASSMGINTVSIKLLAFSFGSCLAGVAGSIFAAKQGTVTPDSFDFTLSVMVLAMVVLGGMGSIRGSIAGALILTILPEFLREFSVYRILIFGIALVAMMIFRPQGIIGSTQRGRELRPLLEAIRIKEDESLEERRKG